MTRTGLILAIATAFVAGTIMSGLVVTTQQDDPVFGYVNATHTLTAHTAKVTGSSCGGAPYTRTNATMEIFVPASNTVEDCKRIATEYDISSIPQQIVVTNALLRIDTDGSQNDPRNCDINPMQFQPSTLDAENLYFDAGNGTAYVSNSSVCTNNTPNNIIDLGPSADTDIQNARANNSTWFGIGIKIINEARDGLHHYLDWDAGRVIELQVTYFEPGPPPPTVIVQIKNTTETISNDAVLSNDAELCFATVQNSRYVGTVRPFITSGSTPDFKYSFSVPSGTTGDRGVGAWSATTAVATANITSQPSVATNGAKQTLAIPFHLSTSTTTGNVCFQWAQNTASAASTTVHAGSSLVVFKE